MGKTQDQITTTRTSTDCASESKVQDSKIAEKFESDDFNIKILLLSVADPELNPIEMAWSHIKREAGRNKLKFSLSAVEGETRKEINCLTAEDSRKYVAYAMKEEDKFRQQSCKI